MFCHSISNSNPIPRPSQWLLEGIVQGGYAGAYAGAPPAGYGPTATHRHSMNPVHGDRGKGWFFSFRVALSTKVKRLMCVAKICTFDSRPCIAFWAIVRAFLKGKGTQGHSMNSVVVFIPSHCPIPCFWVCSCLFISRIVFNLSIKIRAAKR